MDRKDLEAYKKKLLQLRMAILNGGPLNSAEDLYVSSDDLSDETDLATSVIHQQVSLQIREKEMIKLRLIEEALERIDEGTFGHCVDCDEEIEPKRLMNQPWTPYCIQHAEERERDSVRAARVVRA